MHEARENANECTGLTNFIRSRTLNINFSRIKEFDANVQFCGRKLPPSSLTMFSDHPIAKQISLSYMHALAFHSHALLFTCDAMRATASGRLSFKPLARRFWAKKPVWWISSPSNSRGLNLILYSCTESTPSSRLKQTPLAHSSAQWI